MHRKGGETGRLRANHKKVFRIYQEEGLAVKRRRGRKRAVGTRSPMQLPEGPNQRWSLDFVSDALSDGRRFRTLCVVDDFTREALATVVDVSLSGIRVARELSRLIDQRGRPQMIVSDNVLPEERLLIRGQKVCASQHVATSKYVNYRELPQ